MPYLYHYGSYHPGIYTLECSRSGGGSMAALANMRLLGKEGFRVLIGHVVEMAEMLRERLEQHPFIQVLNEKNHGPVTLFRVYPPGVDAAQAWQRELTDPGYREELAAHNAYNQRIFTTINERPCGGKGSCCPGPSPASIRTMPRLATCRFRPSSRLFSVPGRT